MSRFSIVFFSVLIIAISFLAAVSQAAPKAQGATISITNKGFTPVSVNFKTGVPARVTFVRKTNATCATSVVFPTLKINRALPLNKPVTVQFTPRKTGTIVFTCGMKMLRGTLVVK
jgi:plastocyanin domain-containing protein